MISKVNKSSFLQQLLLFTSLLIIFFCYLIFKEKVFGSISGDYMHQHYKFIDYLRHNFWQTHDLFPQYMNNYAGGANMASMIYYGLFNPFITISYFLPFISTTVFLRVLAIVLIWFAYFNMRVLLKDLKINDAQAFVISVIFAFSPALMYHLGYHIMFIYFYPFVPLSFYFINIIVNKNKIWPFTLSVALIILTNFYFALAIGFVQLIYFVWYYFVYCQKQSNYSLKVIIIKLIIGYIVGTLLTMWMFLPQVILNLNSHREPIDISYSMISAKYINSFLKSPYANGLYLLPVLTYVIAIFNLKKDKLTFILLTLLFSVVIITKFNLILNFMLYFHTKVFIYLTPLYLVILAKNISTINNLKKIIIVSITSLILFYLSITYKGKIDNYLMVFAVMQLSLLLYVIKCKGSNIKLSLIMLIIMFTSVKSFANMITIQQEENINDNAYKTNQAFEGFYRSQYNTYNYIKNLNDIDISGYFSGTNENWWLFHNKDNVLAKRAGDRTISHTAYNNILYRYFLGLRDFSDYHNSNIAKASDVRPFIFGVYDRNSYNKLGLNNLEESNRIFALQEAFFTTSSKRIYNFNKFKSKEILNLSDYSNREKESKFKLNLDNVNEDGILVADVELKDGKIKKPLTINFNNQVMGNFYPVKTYNSRQISSTRLYLDLKKDAKDVFISVPKTKLGYKTINVKFYQKSEIIERRMDYVDTTNQKLVLNNGYQFSINMSEDGYLGTSIFFDEGYKIYVNDKLVASEKVNNNFLGAKLAKGSYDIRIEYQMPGFELGVLVTFVGIFIFAIIIVFEVKYFNKPFYRFILVGVFNTINYFIAYRLLLLVLNYLSAHIIAFLFSAFCSYFLTSYFTFKTKPTLKTLIKFPLTFLPNLVLSSVGTSVFVEFNILSKSVASLVMMILIIPITFIINKLIFRERQ